MEEPIPGRNFSSGKGGLGVHPGRTAILFIEFQNEFVTEGGQLHGSVKECMRQTDMLANATALVREIRAMAQASSRPVPPVTLFHAPITFAEDGLDNPNRYLGILGGCDSDKHFTRGTWGARLAPDLRPEGWTAERWGEWGDERSMNDQDGDDTGVDVLVRGKRGLSAFPGTDLAQELQRRGIETLAVAGFMANCCVESTVREACERGFNVISLTDCVSTTSMAGYTAGERAV